MGSEKNDPGGGGKGGKYRRGKKIDLVQTGVKR